MANKTEKSLVYIFSYLLTWLSGLIVYITVGQENKRFKFHALQAIFLGIVMILLDYFGDMIFAPGADLLVFLIWIYGLYIGYKAYEGKDVEMPVIGEYAKKYSK